MVSCILPGLLHNNRSSLPLFTGLRAYCRTDWNGESAAFFQIVLSDGTPRGQLLSLTKQISQAIVQQVQPLEEWGVLPYFNFRTQSEQARIEEPALAWSDGQPRRIA